MKNRKTCGGSISSRGPIHKSPGWTEYHTVNLLNSDLPKGALCPA